MNRTSASLKIRAPSDRWKKPFFIRRSGTPTPSLSPPEIILGWAQALAAVAALLQLLPSFCRSAKIRRQRELSYAP